MRAGAAFGARRLKHNLASTQGVRILFFVQHPLPGVVVRWHETRTSLSNSAACARAAALLSNRGSRFQPTRSEWEDGIEGPSPVTECRAVDARSIIARKRHPTFLQPVDQPLPGL